MAGSRELAQRRQALLLQGEAQRARLHQQSATLRNTAARLDRVIQRVPGAVSPPVLAGAGVLLVLILGRQRSLRLAAGALGAWAMVQRFRQLGASLGWSARRPR